MQTGLKLVTFWLGLCLLFSACSSAEGEASPTPDPEAVLTAAAQTAAAQMTELAAPQPTNTSPSTPVDTLPANTPAVPNTTAVSPQGTTSPVPTAVTGGTNLAEFWADVTIPDGTDFNPGEEFTKIWKLRNSGTNTWTPEYSFAFFTGEQMSAPNQVPLTTNVASGDTVDVAVDMVAPQAGGNYTGYWKMRDPAGEFFDYSVYVQIDVVGGSQPAETSAPPPSGARRRLLGQVRFQGYLYRWITPHLMSVHTHLPSRRPLHWINPQQSPIAWKPEAIPRALLLICQVILLVYLMLALIR